MKKNEEIRNTLNRLRRRAKKKGLRILTFARGEYVIADLRNNAVVSYPVTLSTLRDVEEWLDGDDESEAFYAEEAAAERSELMKRVRKDVMIAVNDSVMNNFDCGEPSIVATEAAFAAKEVFDKCFTL